VDDPPVIPDQQRVALNGDLDVRIGEEAYATLDVPLVKVVVSRLDLVHLAAGIPHQPGGRSQRAVAASPVSYDPFGVDVRFRNYQIGSGVGAVMTTVGIIGSGMIGGTVARLSVAAGYHVVVSNSRGPETLAELAAELGPLATAGTAGQAAEAGDLVLVSVPVKAFGDLPVKPLDGKPVMDTGNYYPRRDGHLAELDTGALTSSGLLQRDLPGAQVVKVFNNIYFRHLASLARPHGAQDRSALPIAGDDAAAKAAVTAFLDSIGYDAVDAGSLADSWHQEPGTPVYGTPYGPFTDEAGTVAPAARIHADLVGAHR
jgi:8-hydroxy-5-deazaflavin:NADPH oxidoreductase